MTEYMKQFNSDPEVIAYKQFMFDPNNCFNCAECPENISPSGDYRGCGQQHCWVSVHCDHH